MNKKLAVYCRALGALLVINLDVAWFRTPYYALTIAICAFLVADVYDQREKR